MFAIVLIVSPSSFFLAEIIFFGTKVNIAQGKFIVRVLGLVCF